MKIRKINIKDLREYENNPVIHSREQITKLAEIIKRYGFRQPIVIDRNNVIVAGHGRLQAVKKLGYKEIDCVVADNLTDDQVRAYRLADNKIKELSLWDGFLGSGSSLIAAEISGKNMYGLEYEEEYCQMIIERYLNFTGDNEIRINGQKVLWSEYKESVPNE